MYDLYGEENSVWDDYRGVNKTATVTSFTDFLAWLKTIDLDTMAEKFIRSKGATPSCKGYEGFPYTLCISVNDEVVQIRHFSIIDEAHYMLDFDNRPLRNLIAVGRNKGLSIILATQNMSSFKSKGFDFYANAQYPLIMKQQTIDDKVIKDLFSVSGQELQEIRTAIAGLQKGELIIKDQMAFALGMGNKYKKINVTHLI